jgi:Isochorismatase family
MTDMPIHQANTRDALIALHFQNDTCHPEGRISFSLDRDSGDAERFLDASKRALEAARRTGWTIVHKHIVFATDYSDVLRNCPLFLKAEALGALKRGSWGAAPYEGFEPCDGEIFVTGNGNSAFRRTGLEGLLAERAIGRVNVRPGDAVLGRAYHARRSRHRLSRQAVCRLLRFRRHRGASRIAAHAAPAGGGRQQRGSVQRMNLERDDLAR